MRTLCRQLLVVLSCLIWCGVAMAQSAEPPAQTAPREPGLDSLGYTLAGYPLLYRAFLPEHCFLTRLDNDLKVLACRDKTSPLAQIEYVSASGVSAEPEAFQGAAHVLEQLLIGPNGKLRSTSGFSARLQQLGLHMDTELSTGALKLRGTSPAQNWTESLQMLSWMVRFPKIDTMRVEGAKRKIATIAARAEQDPRYYLNNTFEDRLWGPEKRLHSTLPAFLPLRTLSTSAVQRFHESHCVPNASLVAITGNMPVQDVFEMADSLWGGWPKSSTYASTAVDSKTLTNDLAVALTHPDIQSPILRIGWALPGILDRPREMAKYDLAAAYLNSSIGPLKTKLLQAGMADSLTVLHEPSVIGGSFEMHLRVPPMQLLFAMEEVWRALDTLALGDSAINQLALRTARNQVHMQRLTHLQSSIQHTQSLADAWAGVGISQIVDYDEAVDTISGAALSRFFKERLVKSPVVVTVMMQSQLLENYSVQYYLSDLDRSPPKKKEKLPTADPMDAIWNGPDSAQVAAEMLEVAEKMEEMTGTKANLDSIYNAYLMKMRVLAEINIIPEAAAAQNAIAGMSYPDDFTQEDTLYAFLDSIQKRMGGLTVPYFKASGQFPVSAREQLNRIIKFLALRPDLKLYVDGHTDAEGSMQDNAERSREQAQALADYIIRTYDIDPKRIVARGMGETMLLVPTDDPDSAKQNERIEFNFLP